MYIDRDSLVYETETDHNYEDFHEDEDLFGLSDYPKFFKIQSFLVLSVKKLLVK